MDKKGWVLTDGDALGPSFSGTWYKLDKPVTIGNDQVFRIGTSNLKFSLEAGDT
jgi:hypothetical protein